MSVPVQKLAVLSAFETYRGGFIRVGNYDFVMGSSIISLLGAFSAVNMVSRDFKVKAISLSGGTQIHKGVTIKSGLKFDAVTSDTIEYPFMLVEYTVLNQIEGLVVYKNAFFDCLQNFNRSQFIAVPKKLNDYIYSFSLDGVVLRVREFEDSFYICPAKAPASSVPMDTSHLNFKVRPVAMTKFTVQDSMSELRGTLDRFQREYASVRPRTKEELTHQAVLVKEDSLGKIEQYKSELLSCESELRGLVAKEDDLRLIYERYRAEVLIEMKNGNIDKNFAINGRISSGTYRKWTANEIDTFQVRDIGDKWEMLTADLALDSQVALSQRKTSYDRSTGMWTVSQPVTRTREEYTSNPLYNRLSDLLKAYKTSESKYRWLTERKSQLEARITELQGLLSSLNDKVRRVTNKYGV